MPAPDALDSLAALYEKVAKREREALGGATLTEGEALQYKDDHHALVRALKWEFPLLLARLRAADLLAEAARRHRTGYYAFTESGLDEALKNYYSSSKPAAGTGT